jgi:hypothetical protein
MRKHRCGFAAVLLFCVPGADLEARSLGIHNGVKVTPDIQTKLTLFVDTKKTNSGL